MLYKILITLIWTKLKFINKAFNKFRLPIVYFKRLNSRYSKISSKYMPLFVVDFLTNLSRIINKNELKH